MIMNKDIQLTGIGNALVDIQFEVSDAELADFSFEKGTMTLVDSSVQLGIMQSLGNRTHYKMSGGSAANTIAAFSSFGGKTAYKTMVGDDDLGRFYIGEFRDLGIIIDAGIDKESPTGTCFILITPDAERTMITSLGATVRHGREHIRDEVIKRSEWIYIEGYKLTEDIGFEAVNHAIDLAKKFDTKVAFTFSDKFIIDVFRDKLNTIIGKSDLVFCNELEARTFTGYDDAEHAFKELSSLGCNLAMTLGDKGSVVKWGGDVLNIPSYPAKAIDTTGAGDMYAGGFLYGLIMKGDPEIAGRLGSLGASRIVSQYGPRLQGSHTDLKKEIFDSLK